MQGYWIIFIVFMLLSLLVSEQLKSRFKKYSRIPLNNNMTGKEIAEKMLHDNGIYDVQVVSVQGHLSDNYNPRDKTVNLSPEVYNGNSISAGAVAAHECGHAVQHATGYRWLEMRSTLVPVVSFASHWVQWVLLAGLILINIFPSLILIGIGLFALTTVFSIITLPVEINASQRALAWLSVNNVTIRDTQPYAKDALKWAAYTYIIAALASLAQLVYWIMVYSNRRS